MAFIHQRACTGYQFRIETYAFSNRKGITAPWFADVEFVLRHQVAFVKGHIAVYDARRFVGHYLQVQVMRCNDTEGMFAVQLFQYHFCKSATEIGIAAAAQLIDKEQSFSIRLLYEKFHVL